MYDRLGLLFDENEREILEGGDTKPGE